MSEPIEPCPNPQCKCEKPMRAFAYCWALYHCVQCPECGMQGPLFDTHDGAIGAWNAIARAVREATEWRQRAESFADLIRDINFKLHIACLDNKTGEGRFQCTDDEDRCAACPLHFIVTIPTEEPEPEPKRRVCVWTFNTDSDTWDGGCGVVWQMIEGTPLENQMNFCPSCGCELESDPPARPADGGDQCK